MQHEEIRFKTVEKSAGLTSEYNPFSLKGKSILVTGASSGIGQATAIECSRLGATVIITGRDVARLQTTFSLLEGNGHRQVIADLTRDDDLSNLIAACPQLNGVALCAGAIKPLPLKFSTKTHFSETFDVNFNAPVECIRLLLKAKKIATQGSVVFVSSIAGMSGGTAIGEGTYGASKAALAAIVRYFAKECAGRKMRFNSVNPGMVKTPFIETTARSLSVAEQQNDVAVSYPLGRIGEPDDIAHAIVFLLSDASSWVTGQQLVIDGGFTL